MFSSESPSAATVHLEKRAHDLTKLLGFSSNRRLRISGSLMKVSFLVDEVVDGATGGLNRG